MCITKAKFDGLLIILSAALSVFGVFAVFSATRTIGGYSNTFVQAAAVIIGTCAMLFICVFDYRRFIPLMPYISLGCIMMLVVVLALGITGIWGSKSWIKIGSISIQPSELAKCGFIVTFSYHISRVSERLNSWKVLIGLLLHLSVPLGLILLQPDLGTGIVFVFIFAAILFSGGLSYKYIFPTAAIGLAALPLIYLLLDEYQKKRIEVFLNPGSDPLGRGYNVIQSSIALGSGGTFGNGYLEGTSTQMGLLPAKHTDFIFSSISEEFGFIGSVFVIAALFAIIFRILFIAGKTGDLFGRTICVGVAAMLFFHTFENIGMCMGIMPVTGIPLPFLSYGGTAIITNFIGIGMVLSVDRHARRGMIFAGEFSP